MTTSQASSPSNLLSQVDQIRTQLTGAGAPFERITVQVHGHSYLAYRNAFPNLPALINAGRAHGPREFMVYENERWTFDRFFQQVDALAANLQHQLGVKAGDRVAIAMRNRPEWAVAFAAISLVGAVPAPLNSYGLHDELMANLVDLQPKLLICDPDRFTRVQNDLAALSCKAMVVDGTAQEGNASWQAMTSASTTVHQTPELLSTDPALVLFTSGASSQAKAVLSSHMAVCQALFNIDFIGAISAMTSPKAIELMMAKALQPTTLTAVPLFHVSGLHAQLLTALRHGRRLVFIHRWDPQQAIRLIQKEKITQFNGAPSMVMQLLAEPNFNDPEFTGSLGGVGFGGAGLPQRIIDEILEKRANSMSGIGYGLTETNGVCAAASGQLFQHAPQSAGLTSPIIEVRVVDLDGTDMPLDTEGEIWLRGVSLMEGYLNQQGEKGLGLTDGWLKTGDIGRLEEGGLLRIVDRIKDVINRAGEKIAAAEIESCLLQHPDLLEAAVFSQPDATTGEAVVAVVVLAPHAKLGPDEVKQHVARRLAAYKVPQQVHIRTEVLPKNPAGKMLKNALKREYVQA
jgi:long-chain acyl-CoA synthetase